ncbi:hypothetical protein PoB_007000600 [Plakobranchus ocellatus]|uniref:Uncharacterized protein n=1 Tax=Plakobranchus ocellatus TaxID=259542 RepID=A0AAV4DI13_9GAST|nr:hypothetical protein PoB_007000600 [Plakobranchus ocellatus]
MKPSSMYFSPLTSSQPPPKSLDPLYSPAQASSSLISACAALVILLESSATCSPNLSFLSSQFDPIRMCRSADGQSDAEAKNILTHLQRQLLIQQHKLELLLMMVTGNQSIRHHHAAFQ